MQTAKNPAPASYGEAVVVAIGERDIGGVAREAREGLRVDVLLDEPIAAGGIRVCADVDHHTRARISSARWRRPSEDDRWRALERIAAERESKDHDASEESPGGGAQAPSVEAR